MGASPDLPVYHIRQGIAWENITIIYQLSQNQLL